MLGPREGFGVGHGDGIGVGGADGIGVTLGGTVLSELYTSGSGTNSCEPSLLDSSSAASTHTCVVPEPHASAATKSVADAGAQCAGSCTLALETLFAVSLVRSVTHRTLKVPARAEAERVGARTESVSRQPLCGTTSTFTSVSRGAS